MNPQTATFLEGRLKGWYESVKSDECVACRSWDKIKNKPLRHVTKKDHEQKGTLPHPHRFEPSTARDFNVDPTDVGGNISGGVQLLSSLLLNSHGDIEKALEHYYGSKNAAENQAYAQKVMKVEAGLHIDTVNINVPNGSMSPDALRGAVSRGLNDAQQQRIQRNLSEFSAYSWSY